MSQSRRNGLHGRVKVLLLALIVLLLISSITRFALASYEGEAVLLRPAMLARIMLTGTLYDLAAASWILIPFALSALAWGAGRIGRRGHAVTALLLYGAMVSALLFQSVAEGLFWNEFEARFNFIAVDYLVYTREVVGNIWQSYPIVPMLVGLVVVSLAVLAILARPVWRLAGSPAEPFRRRAAIFVPVLLLPALVWLALGDRPQEALGEPAAKELAGNGTYSLFRAFRNNDLSYARYYRVLSTDAANAELQEEWIEAGLKGRAPQVDNYTPRETVPDGPAQRRSIVLVSVESLGADYVGAFGSTKGLTPNLDALARDSLIFTNLYATGLRTVRGLEALSLSIPPTPGHAVPARTRNKGLDTLGSVLKAQGYDPLYLYGGYAWFDNMRDFFEGNGYTVIDRSAIASADIHHETIWGVADEDLFTLALREIDSRAASGKPVFAHIMTTSNHRPYTYPEGRVSIPSHSGRDGAVQYTDWALGHFMAEARAKPWFDNTIFVIVADHTSHGRGRIDLPPENYRIPLIIYAPGLIQPGSNDFVASQIDVAPTVLGMLNLPYRANFYGQDILRHGGGHQRAFFANYLTVGYMQDGLIVELAPQHRARVVEAASGNVLPPDDPRSIQLIKEAVSQYQAAAAYLEAKAQP